MIDGEGKPAFSVIIIDSRSKTHPEWVKKAVDSIKEQSLSNVELIVIDNTEHLCSIGSAYNQGIKEAKADWVYLLGDDDYISPDFLASLKVFIDRYVDDSVVMCSTYSTFFDDEKRVMSINTKSPFGACRRDYFLEHKFDETLTKYIDVDAHERLKADGKKMVACKWHFGYYYRQHEDNVSGRKIIKPIEINDRKNIKSLPGN